MQIIKTTIIFFSIIFSIFLFTPQAVEASAASTLSSGADTAAGQAGLESTDINVTIASIVGNLLSMIGVLFFILMLYGGILWMTARGDTDQTQKAMNTLIAATVGIVIVLASYAITDFVLGSLGSGGGGSNSSAATTNSNQLPQLTSSDETIISSLKSTCTKDSDCPSGISCNSTLRTCQTKCATQKGGHYCQEISNCSSDSINSYNDCTSKNDCKTGLCPGSKAVVCCK